MIGIEAGAEAGAAGALQLLEHQGAVVIERAGAQHPGLVAGGIVGEPGEHRFVVR